jgi:hypothetical protein
MAQVVMFWTCIQEMAKTPTIMTEIFMGFLNLGRKILGEYLTFGHGFLPHPFQFIIQYFLSWLFNNIVSIKPI